MARPGLLFQALQQDVAEGPKKITPPSIEELLALLSHDNKCRFELRCVAGLQLATREGLAYWPFKIWAVQGHSQKAMTGASASDTFNATTVYANSGAAVLCKRIPELESPLSLLMRLQV